MQFEATKGYPDWVFPELADLGLLGMTTPEAVGGAGTDMVSYALSLIEIAAADGPLSTILSIQNSLIVARHPRASAMSCSRGAILPDLIAGRVIGAFASDRDRRRLRRLRPAHPRRQGGGRLADQWIQAVHHLGQDRRGSP